MAKKDSFKNIPWWGWLIGGYLAIQAGGLLLGASAIELVRERRS